MDTIYVIEKSWNVQNLQMSSTLIKLTEHAQIATAPPFLGPCSYGSKRKAR